MGVCKNRGENVNEKEDRRKRMNEISAVENVGMGITLFVRAYIYL